jgi:diguanylate cyclase (GGDEF)-like protein
MLLAATTALALAATVVAALAVRKSRQWRRELTEARTRLEHYVSDVPDASDETGVRAVALRRDAQQRFVARETEHYRNLLAHLLGDFRDAAGAEEAVYWQWSAERDSLVAVDWSTEGPGPAFFDYDEWDHFVRWAADEGEVKLAGQGQTVHMGAVCVMLEQTQLGVLTLTNRHGLRQSRAELHKWLPRLANQLGYFHDLVTVRLRYGSHMRRSEALLDAVRKLQGDSSGEGLAQSVCETALEVSGARGAALIRWNAESEQGEVHFATAGIGIVAPAALDPASMIAEACRAAAVQVLENARDVATGRALYGIDRVIRVPGSIAIMPLVRDGRVVGAVVLESEDVGSLTLDDVRPLAVLGAVVAGSLEMAWSYQEVDRRARTDALTGLYNRMHFAEELERRLVEADRRNQPLSLVLVDIDHFKKVNDTWGHEAGDAVLKHIARILHEGSREVDSCFRFGGEEIALLMAQTESERAVDVAERLRARIAATIVRHGGAEIAVTASFGVATYPETVKVRDQLFPASDKALYIAKNAGRNCVRAKPSNKGKTAT